MRATGPSIAIIQHLKSLGIKVRTSKKSPSPDSQRKTSCEGLFGVALHSLPLHKKEGNIPQFVVDICQYLSHHLGTEGLFRKSGSVTRIKTLKAQLESGVTSFSSAHPSDVAALLKQFFRDLPQPLVPLELQDALCQIQESVPERLRGSATTLVTSLLPPVQGATLRYFCTFLQEVASRYEENKMDAGNLAVVLAPNLFSNSGEKLTINMERQLQLQTAAMQTLIEHAPGIGQLPLFILEKLQLPNDGAEDESVMCSSGFGGGRRRRRRSMSGLVNDALNKLKPGRTAANANPERGPDEIDQPLRNKTKRKASEDSVSGETFSAKKRKSLRGTLDENFDCEDPCLPTILLSPCRDSPITTDVFPEFSSCTGSFLAIDTSSLATPSTPKPSHRGQRSRNQRKETKRMSRMHSGLICVSPVQLERKEKVRSSLRLFHRSRPAKQSTSEGKTLEQSSWNMVKRMVAEALDGPIFNARDVKVAPLTLKAVDYVTPSSSGASTPDCPSSPSSLRSSSPWKLKLWGRSEVEGKKRRALRRSLSMPEVSEGLVSSQSEDTNEEGGIHQTGVVEGPGEGKALVKDTDLEICPLLFDTQCMIEPKIHPTLSSQLSISKLSHIAPTFRRSDAHPMQFRSVRKLILSYPSASHTHTMDPDLKDWEKLATHTLRRKGARRFGRSLSHESGLGTAEEKGTQEQDNPKPSNNLRDRERQVFVSHKKITLSNCGQRSLDNDLLTTNWEPSIIHNMVEGDQCNYRGSPKCSLSGVRLEPVIGSMDL
ncbi:rho GTPase-activating protein 11A-like [Discoglossus pictus]